MKTLNFKVIQDYGELRHEDSIVDLIDSQLKSYKTIKTRNDILSSLENALSPKSRSVLFLAINESGRYIGFAFSNINSGLESGGDYLWINELFIEAEERESGIGRRLISYIEEWCSTKSISYIACSTGVKNSRAQGFYKSMDYKLCDTIWVDKELK